MGWYTDLVEKAEQDKQNAPKTIDELRHTRAQIYAEEHAQEVQAMLDGIGRGIALRKERELEQKQLEESERAKEQERLKDIAKNGSNDSNDKAKRDLMKKLVSDLNFKSADRTADILS